MFARVLIGRIDLQRLSNCAFAASNLPVMPDAAQQIVSRRIVRRQRHKFDRVLRSRRDSRRDSRMMARYHCARASGLQRRGAAELDQRLVDALCAQQRDPARSRGAVVGARLEVSL